jgi:hypothetical protein
VKKSKGATTSGNMKDNSNESSAHLLYKKTNAKTDDGIKIMDTKKKQSDQHIEKISESVKKSDRGTTSRNKEINSTVERKNTKKSRGITKKYVSL